MIALYVDFFFDGNFRLPITKFVANLLGINPDWDMFNVFYFMACNAGFYSFSARNNVTAIGANPSKSLHDWKHKFFYIREVVIPKKMTFRDTTQKIPKWHVMKCDQRDLFKT
ncbi:hypothetical protein Hanom_Chr12g01178121 [Helianthus anomalus]